MRTAAILPVKRFASAKQRLGASVADPLRRDLARAMVGDVLSALRDCAAIERTIVVTCEESVVAAARYLGAIVVPDAGEEGQSAAVAQGIERAAAEGFERVLCIPGDCPALDPGELESLLAETGMRAKGECLPATVETGMLAETVIRAAGACLPASIAGECPPATVVGPVDAAGARTASADAEGAAPGADASRREVVIVPDRHGTGTNGLLLTPPDAIAPSFGPDSHARHRQLARAARAVCRTERLPSLLLDIDTGEDLDALRERLRDETRTGARRTRAVLGAQARSPRAA